MTWETPIYLLLLLLVAVLAAGSVVFRSRLRERRRTFFSDAVFIKLYTPEQRAARKTRSTLFYTSLILLIIALAGPKVGTEVREVKRQGIDIMVVLDVSKSMYAEDVRPSRLDKAKFEILRMMDRLTGDRVGLIVFTGEALQLAPLTADYAAFRLYLSLADPSSMPSTTTDFAAALAAAIEAFDSASSQQQEAARVMLIVSDGEDHGTNVSEYREALASRGIFIYTVGIGTTAGGTIPLYDERTGRLQDYVRDSAGQVVTTRLNATILRELAEAGRGTYYEISRSSDGMDGFIAQIADLEKREFATQEFADYKNQYQWFAGIGFLLLITSLLIPTYKPPQE